MNHNSAEPCHDLLLIVWVAQLTAAERPGTPPQPAPRECDVSTSRTLTPSSGDDPVNGANECLIRSPRGESARSPPSDRCKPALRPLTTRPGGCPKRRRKSPSTKCLPTRNCHRSSESRPTSASTTTRPMSRHRHYARLSEEPLLESPREAGRGALEAPARTAESQLRPTLAPTQQQARANLQMPRCASVRSGAAPSRRAVNTRVGRAGRVTAKPLAAAGRSLNSLSLRGPERRRRTAGGQPPRRRQNLLRTLPGGASALRGLGEPPINTPHAVAPLCNRRPRHAWVQRHALPFAPGSAMAEP